MPLPINWDEAKGGAAVKPGIYLLEVTEARQKKSQAGDWMVEVDFKVLGHRFDRPVRDYFMLGGKMGWSGPKKICALGFEKGANVEAHELVGRRCYAALKNESREYQGNQYVDPKVDMRAEGSTCGLWREDEPPPGAPEDGPLVDAIDEKPLTDDDVPF